MGSIVNGVDVEKLKKMLGEIEANKELVVSNSRLSARVAWLGSAFNFKVYARHHFFKVSEPYEVSDSRDEGPKPSEYVLGALGACYAIGFILNATKRGIAIKNLEVLVEGEIDNILVFFGLSDKGHPGFKRITVKAYIDAEAEEDVIRNVWEETVRTSPVGNTIERPVEVKTELKIVRTWL